MKFPYWWTSNLGYHDPFSGTFTVEWVYIKDIDYAEFRKNLDSSDLKNSIYSRDCSEISPKLTLKMLQIFDSKTSNNIWIFDDFKYMDER